jgi:3',5'-cyclic AMP phosphodiesterase CpdA
MANYSLDYGDAHFLCLDSNQYVDPTDTALQAWIEQDLSGTDALWKFVVYHHPSFNVGNEHYMEQQFRVLAPLFEKHGVDMALHGHEHTYQRTQPIKFVPGDTSKAGVVSSKDRRIPGTFTIDTNFDGAKNLVADGIIYIVTGAGGKELYEPDFTDSPARWLHPDDNNVAYVSRFYSRHHSFTVIDIDGRQLNLTQVNEFGDMVDQMTLVKA